VKQVFVSSLVALVLGLASWLVLDQRAPAESGAAGLVRIGLVKSLFRGTPEAVMQVAMRPFKTLLETQTGVTGQVVGGGGAMTLAHKLKNDQVQLAVFHGFEFAWAQQKYPSLKPIIIAVNQQPIARAVLVVRHTSKATSYAHLKGKVVALPAHNKEHCRLYFERRCVKPGVSAKKFYGDVLDPVDSEEALEEVADGNADATVVDGVAFASWCKNKPRRSRQVKILAESEPFPCAVVACNDGKFDAATVQRFRTALLNAHKNTAGQKLIELIKITGFESVPPTYADQLAEIARLYPPAATH